MEKNTTRSNSTGSIRCKGYWIERFSMTEEEAKVQISKIQSEYAKRRKVNNSNKNRRSYSDEEIERIYNEYLEKGYSYSSISNKNYKSFEKYSRSLVKYLDRESRNKLLYKIYSPLYCKYCGKIIEYEAFNKKSKRCLQCIKENNYVYPKLRKKRKFDESYSKIISVAKKKFFQTDYGKKVAKKVGEINSVKMKEYNKTEKGKDQIKKNSLNNSKIMLEKILNGEFTPCITNTFTHWNAIIYLNDNSIKKFRSSWEACFWFCNQHLEYEKFRIPYYDKNGKKRSYIVDFYDREKNILYEIKPKSFWETQDEKMQQAFEYCILNKINLKWINEYNIMNYIQEEKFKMENLKQLEKMKKGINYNEKIENNIYKEN